MPGQRWGNAVPIPCMPNRPLALLLPADTTVSLAGVQHCQGLIRCHSLSGTGHLFGFGLCWGTESRLVPLPRVTATAQQCQAGQGLRAVLCDDALWGLGLGSVGDVDPACLYLACTW